MGGSDTISVLDMPDLDLTVLCGTGNDTLTIGGTGANGSSFDFDSTVLSGDGAHPHVRANKRGRRNRRECNDGEQANGTRAHDFSECRTKAKFAADTPGGNLRLPDEWTSRRVNEWWTAVVMRLTKVCLQR